MRALSNFFISEILIFLCLILNPVFAQTVTTITFDEPFVSTPPPDIGVRYSNRGVLFPAAAKIISLPSGSLNSKAHSGKTVLVSDDLAKEFDPDPLIIEFTYSVQGVILYTGIPWDTHGRRAQIVLEAFDGNNNFVSELRQTLVGPTDMNFGMRVMAPQMQHIIRKVKLEVIQEDASCFEFIDDLQLFSEGKPPTIAHEPPQVFILSPTEKETATGSIPISGKIVGKGLFPEHAPPELIISYPTDPLSGLLSLKQNLILNADLHWVYPTPPEDPYLIFSLPFQLEHFGQNTITVRASNAVGVGSATTYITYFPKYVIEEYNIKGGWNKFGDFIWGGTKDNCSFAIYQKGAIFNSSAGTFSVLGEIFIKWKSLTTPSIYLGLLGCAKGPAKNELPGGSTYPDIIISQDFYGGRIYSSKNEGTYYVIQPFVDAIDKLDLTYIGVPVTDPVEQAIPLLPKLWQKFKIKWWSSSAFFSSMEVTDNPLTLWVAMPDIKGAHRSGTWPWERIPTVWLSFKCSSMNQPCIDVKEPQTTGKQSYSFLENACKGGHYPTPGVPAWPSLATKKIIPYIGNITSSHLSSGDWPDTHDCTCAHSFGGVDWCTQIVPDPGFESLLGEKQSTLEIEYEYCKVGYPFKSNPKDYLKSGDKLFVAGRWVADCNCHPWPGCSDPIRSEIHPPAVMINMHTAMNGGQSVTIGEIVYLDWWYPNEVVEMDIFPPPRPLPNAVLAVDVPLWNNMCPLDGGKCGIQNSQIPTNSPNHVHLKISGRSDVLFNTPPIEEGNGEMHHGHLLPCPGGREPLDLYYPHTKSLWGDFKVYWTKP